MLNRTRPLPLHPPLLALLPLLLILQQNLLEISPGQIRRSALASLLFVGLVWLAVFLLRREVRFAALLSSLSILLFHAVGRFHSGNVHGAVRAVGLNSGLVGDPALSLALAAGIFVLGVIALHGLRRYVDGMTVFANVAAVSLTTVTLVGVGLREGSLRQPLQSTPVEPASAASAASIDSPDIFVIVLDGYGRRDVLEDLYAYDNASFLAELEDLGFQVVPRARSNYMQTSLSLASALNFDYLQNLLPASVLAGQDRAALVRLIRHSQFSRVLEGRGYGQTALASGYRATELTQADVYLQSGSIATNLFERLVVENSGVGLLASLPGAPPAIAHPGYGLHRERIEFAFEAMARPAGADPRPRWTFVHILAPHPPFVFDEVGNPIQPDYPYVLLDGSAYPGEMGTYRRQYVGQVRFVNQNLIRALRTLIAENGKEAAIVIHGDHGPGSELDWESFESTNHRERFGVMLAYRLPEARTLPTEVVSPVNLYRALLNDLFQTELHLLETRSYFSRWRYLYNFESVPNPLLEPSDTE